MNKAILFILMANLAVSSSCQKPIEQPITAFLGASLIDGNGGTAIENSLLIIQGGRVLSAGRTTEISIPKGAKIVDVSGKTIIPGLINTHAHVGYYKAVDAAHYSAENIQEQLELYARFGITSVASLGEDRTEAKAFQAKNDAKEAIGRSRLYIAGVIVSGSSVEEVKNKVDENATNGSDFIKIRVDNNRGRSEAMKPEIYKAIIEQSHKHDLMLMAHMYDLAIAKDLLQSGADFLAHSVRDKEVDEELVSLLKTTNVCYCPTLTRDLSTFVYGDTAAFFSDPFFIKYADTREVEMLLDAERQARIRKSNDYNDNKAALEMAKVNLNRLSKFGATIAMGTDSGMPTRFQGYFEHIEMQMMAEVGMPPMQIIKSATGDAAKCLGLKDVGTLEKGKLADFIILDANPLINILNTRQISSVWIGGKKLN